MTFEAEVEPQEDYDDVLLPQTLASEQGERFDSPGPTSDLPLLASTDADTLYFNEEHQQLG